MRTLVFFGATGNLFTRKILPALVSLSSLGETFRVLAIGRRFEDTSSYCSFIATLLCPLFPQDVLLPFLERVTYVRGDILEKDLAGRLSHLFSPRDYLYFYLSTLPSLYRPALHLVAQLCQEMAPESLCVALEKPFGQSGKDFLLLEEDLKHVFPEDHVFYVDHYLGKATVQNLIVLKAENLFVERLLSREFVEEVRIAVFEEEGVGERGTFYEETGAIKDIFQNHLLQLLSLLTVDIPPLCEEDQRECTAFLSKMAKRKAALLSRIRLPKGEDVQLGQYEGYRRETGNPYSLRETFFFLPLFLETERWRGVPFYLASGKRMAEKRSFIEVLFSSTTPSPNRLIIEIQPEERIDLIVHVRTPELVLGSSPVTLNFSYSGTFKANTPQAYEKILYDFLHRDRTLFPDSAFIREAWHITDALLATLQRNPPRFCRYREGMLTSTALFTAKKISNEICLE